MRFRTQNFILKNDESVLLRSPEVKDAEKMVRHHYRLAQETETVLRYPEECRNLLEETEWISGINASQSDVMLIAEKDKMIIGHCHLSRYELFKIRHRATISVAVYQDYWGLGLAKKMMELLMEEAKVMGILQCELDLVESNKRAQKLYEKLGFKVAGVKLRAIQLKDGQLLSEISMVKEL